MLIDGVIAGLLLGAGVCGHALRVVALRDDLEPDDLQRGRIVLAVVACVVYTFSFLTVLCGWSIGLWIAALGPVVGLLIVILLPTAHVDTFQWTLGIFQAIAALLAWYRLLGGG